MPKSLSQKKREAVQKGLPMESVYSRKDFIVDLDDKEKNIQALIPERKSRVILGELNKKNNSYFLAFEKEVNPEVFEKINNTVVFEKIDGKEKKIRTIIGLSKDAVFALTHVLNIWMEEGKKKTIKKQTAKLERKIIEKEKTKKYHKEVIVDPAKRLVSALKGKKNA